MRDLDQPEMGAAEPWWLNLELFGFEDDDDDDLDDDDEDADTDEDEDEEDEESDDDEDDEDSDEDDEDEDDDSEKEKKSKSKGKNIAGLKSALRKERMGRKRAERELRQIKARRKANTDKSTSKDKKDKSEDKEEVEETGPSEREKRLAASLLSTAVDRAILAVAQKQKFLDPEDAVKLISRKDIVVDQDDEDPTDIDIDEESIEDAVKALAKKKKHLINRGTSPNGKTGSKVGGGRKNRGELNDANVREKFGLGPARR